MVKGDWNLNMSNSYIKYSVYLLSLKTGVFFLATNTALGFKIQTGNMAYLK